MRALARIELGAHCGEVSGDIRARLRNVRRAEQLGDAGGFRVVAVLIGARQQRVHVAQMRGEKARHFGDMHPREQCRVARAIRAAVEPRAVDGRVNRLHALDQLQRVGPAAVCRAGDERRGAAQAAEDVDAERRMVPDARQRERMQRLQQQRGDAARHHRREIGMYFPAHRVGAEEARVARRGRIVERRAAAARCQMRDAARDARPHAFDERMSERRAGGAVVKRGGHERLVGVGGVSTRRRACPRDCARGSRRRARRDRNAGT